MNLLTQLNLLHFKNHLSLKLDVNKKIINIIGKNGTGKTNILDAIYYLCFARSYFIKNDKILQYKDGIGFRIDGFFKSNKIENTVSCILREDGKKEILFNKETISKVSELIGKNICVMVAPDDIAIINEGSEIRRKWIDSIFCQTNKKYLENLQNYQKIILQRNALLKSISEKKEKSNKVLEFYNNQLCIAANYIHKFRKNNFLFLQKMIQEKYLEISNTTDTILIDYQSTLNENDLMQLLQDNLQKDIITQRTNYGIHKDDLLFTMQNLPLKNIASQGQKKSFLLAIKLAEFDFLKSETNEVPILLLDDIFERLDADRIHNLFEIICSDNFTQVFITDTNQKRVEDSLSVFSADFKTICL